MYTVFPAGNKNQGSIDDGSNKNGKQGNKFLVWRKPEPIAVAGFFGGRLPSKCELLKLAICNASPISAVIVKAFPALFPSRLEFDAAKCATGVAHLLSCEMSVSLLLTSAASSSVSVTVFEPSFQLKVMTILSSYKKIELIKISTRILRYAGSSMSPSLNLLIQYTICSFVSGVFSIFSRASATRCNYADHMIT